MSQARGPIPATAPAAAEVMSKAGSENFPVASRLLPRDVRRHLLAIYGFARLVDDAGDEAAGDRLRLLDWLEGDVEAMYEGVPSHPVLRRLAATVDEFGIPPQPLRRLIQANRQDQVVRRYETFRDLRAYCELSANPVGQLVLYVFRAATPERFVLSDHVCTGLQLTEHWQDVSEDLDRGRIYLPLEDLARFGCTEADLRGPRPVPSFEALMAFEVARARDLLRRGLPLARSLRGRPGLAVSAFVGGGMAALEAIERNEYDVLRTAPRPSRPRRAWAIAKAAVAAAIRGGR